MKIFKFFLFIFLFFYVLETSFRVFFPEFSDKAIKTDKINNNNFFFKDIDGFQNFKIRDSKSNLSTNKKKSKIFLLGDSITKGFGLAYQDTFYSVTEQMFNIAGINYEIIPFSLFKVSTGSNLDSQLKKFIEFYEQNKNKYEKSYLIYQFNYNDILFNTGETINKPNWFINNETYFQKFIHWTGKLRYYFLNRSNFLTFLQHKLYHFRISLNNNCSINSLGPYTFAYGTKGFENYSNKAWIKFEKNIQKLKIFAEKNNLETKVLIVPTVLDFKFKGTSNPKKYNLDCATIDAHKKIRNVLKSNEIKILDPTKFMKKISKLYSLENNDKNLFIDLDHNHINERGSRLIGEYLFLKLQEDISIN